MFLCDEILPIYGCYQISSTINLSCFGCCFAQRWAVDSDMSASESLKLNHPDTHVSADNLQLPQRYLIVTVHSYIPSLYRCEMNLLRTFWNY